MAILRARRNAREKNTRVEEKNKNNRMFIKISYLCEYLYFLVIIIRGPLSLSVVFAVALELL